MCPISAVMADRAACRTSLGSGTLYIGATEMARSDFSHEIKQAMTPDDKSPPQSAKLAFPPKTHKPPPAQKAPPQSQLGMPKPTPHMPMHGGSDPIAHATSIAHAILAHGRGGY